MNFTCPYCGHHSTLNDSDREYSWSKIDTNDSTYGKVGVGVHAVCCPNVKCKKLSLAFKLTQAYLSYGNWYEDSTLKDWNLLPESTAKVLPDYIPQAVQEDYYEACKVKELSPKASATLARRALQGMIRDFWGISKARLKDEIDALEEKVDPDTWEAIDAVRSVGNIGAHMERDVNVIVDIEPEEAQLLIGLIEDLIDDWYVVRYQRQQRKQQLKDLASQKEAEIQEKSE